MNEEKRKLIIESAPKLYKNMKFMACDDGWLDLLLNLSIKLEEEINKLPPEEQDNCYVSQIKEKFGTLRFYMSGETDAMSDLIREAEDLSHTTCEGCGSSDTNIVGKSWLVNRCQSCYISYHIERYNKDPEEAKKAYNEYLVQLKEVDSDES